MSFYIITLTMAKKKGVVKIAKTFSKFPKQYR